MLRNEREINSLQDTYNYLDGKICTFEFDEVILGLFILTTATNSLTFKHKQSNLHKEPITRFMPVKWVAKLENFYQ